MSLILDVIEHSTFEVVAYISNHSATAASLVRVMQWYKIIGSTNISFKKDQISKLGSSKRGAVKKN